MVSGRSPVPGSGHSAKPEPSSTVSAVPASVPNAGWLWCVNIVGPDDVHAAPDFDTAERWAANQNAKLRAYTIAAGMESDPHWPEVRAVVAVWPGSAESHAQDLPKSEVEFANSSGPISIEARGLVADELYETLAFVRQKLVQLSAGALANGNDAASQKIDGFTDRCDAALAKARGEQA